MRLDTGFENRSARLEMMPLMDVIFLLLVFFLYAMVTMSVHHGVGVTLPQAVSGTLTGRHVEVVLTAGDELYLEGRLISEPALVRELADGGGGKPILISADEAVPLGRGLALLAAMREAGVGEVAFRTIPPKTSVPGMLSETR